METGLPKFGQPKFDIARLSPAGQKAWAAAVQDTEAAIADLGNLVTNDLLTEKDKKILLDKIPKLKQLDALSLFFKNLALKDGG